MKFTVYSSSPEQTRRLGELLGQLLQGGDCILLDGELGAGKTTFGGGVGLGLEIEAPLTSPTYLLCCEYIGRTRLLHLDAYFEERMDGLLCEGLVERFDSETVLLVEWAVKMEEGRPVDRLQIQFEGSGDNREIAFFAVGKRSIALLNEFSVNQSGLSPFSL